MYLTETVLIGGSAYFYKIALAPWGRVRRNGDNAELSHTISILILVACGLITLQRIEISNTISIGRAMAAFIILTAAYRGGMAAGAETGVAFGLAMDIASGGAPFFSMLYAFSGLISGIFHKQGKLLFVLGFIAADAVARALDMELRIELRGTLRNLYRYSHLHADTLKEACGMGRDFFLRKRRRNS